MEAIYWAWKMSHRAVEMGSIKDQTKKIAKKPNNMRRSACIRSPLSRLVVIKRPATVKKRTSGKNSEEEKDE